MIRASRASDSFNMATPTEILKMFLRRLLRDQIVRKLTFIVSVLLAAVLFCFGEPMKQIFCNANLPKPQYTYDLLGFKHAQNVLCSEPDMLLRANVWNLSYHQGGNGPWVPKVDGVVKDGQTLPIGCAIDQVHMLARHAERYPTTNAGQRHLDLLNRLKNSSSLVGKALAFTKHWRYFTNPSSHEFESLIRDGRYAGTTAAENTGKLLRSRYNHLIHVDKPTKFWSASSPRDVETAEHFAIGFFGPEWNIDHTANLEIIPESPDRGANTLTPGKSCLSYHDDFEYGRYMGYIALDLWQRTFTESIKTRLASAAPGFNFSAVDVYSMFEMCGFEIMVRGVSPWCNVFTNDDWLDFEYGRDLLHFYRAGPGTQYAGAMGMLWLDATLRNMLNESVAAKSVYASFVHDGDIIPVITTLGLLDEPTDPVTGKKDWLPTQSRKWDRNWRTSDVVPMGGRLIFERINCDGAIHPVEHKTFVRLLINDGHMVLGLRTGELLEHDLTLESFERLVKQKRKKFGDFRKICKIDMEGPEGIDFMHQ